MLSKNNSIFFYNVLPLFKNVFTLGMHINFSEWNRAVMSHASVKNSCCRCLIKWALFTFGTCSPEKLKLSGTSHSLYKINCHESLRRNLAGDTMTCRWHLDLLPWCPLVFRICWLKWFGCLLKQLPEAFNVGTRDKPFARISGDLNSPWGS